MFPRRRRPVRPVVAALLSLGIGFGCGWFAHGRWNRTPEELPPPVASAPSAAPTGGSGLAAGRSARPGSPVAVREEPPALPPMPRLSFDTRAALDAARRGGTSVPLQVMRPGVRVSDDSGEGERRILWSGALRNPGAGPVFVAVRGFLRDGADRVVAEGGLETWQLGPGEERVVRGEAVLEAGHSEPLPALWIEYQAWRQGGPAYPPERVGTRTEGARPDPRSATRSR